VSTAEGGRAPLRSSPVPGAAGPPNPRLSWQVKGRTFSWEIDRRGRSRSPVLLMGVVNVTPDSFADGGRYLEPAAALARARTLLAEGADLLDVGAESTRPGSAPVSAAEELDRLQPVLLPLLAESSVPVSVDTAKPEVAAAVLEAGVHVINDITGLAAGPDLARLCARHGAGLVLMHMRGTPLTMQDDVHYDDLLGEIGGRLAGAAARARAAGLPAEAVALDPGIGFGKSPAHNLLLMTAVAPLARLGHPVLIGPSRKSFLGAVLGLPPAERLEGTLAACVAATLAGVHLLRVHDIEPVRRAVRVAEAIRTQARPGAFGDGEDR
jgi:dihydropteroate synthase